MTKVPNAENFALNNRFYVEIDSTFVASFSKCSGIGIHIEKDPYFEGGVNDQQRIVLGHTKFSDITLGRGITDLPYFLEWIGAIHATDSNQSTRHNLNLMQYNQAGQIVVSYTLIGSVPVDYRTSDLLADGKSVATEELTVAIEGLQIGRSSTGGEICSQRNGDGFFGYSQWKQQDPPIES